jgi:radical SAM superfamily enzyme YgiQ (UPF0313 family)
VTSNTPDIVLTTLNARYMHTAFGLRYLYANLGDLQSGAIIDEFTIHERAIDIAEKLLKHQPAIIGFGVYIWNVAETARAVELIKQVSPETIIVLGGPEVSYYPDVPACCELADYVIAGAAEKTFRELCEQLLAGNKPEAKFITRDELALDQITLPYAYYTDDDIRNRLIYVEASRGCPYKCEFCLSSLDRTSKPYQLDQFLHEMECLYQRGVRNYKFIDRTFNLKVDTSIAILEFFLEKIDLREKPSINNDIYLHFEVIPDNLPDKLKMVIQQFPAHALQFEIGVQTFDPDIQALISRKQNNAKTIDNLRWLREQSHAYIHADLIFGLPGDSLENFASSFDQLVALQPHEIQLGILKRLRGVPLNRHNEACDMRYNPEAPYNVLSTNRIDFFTMQRVNRMARFWDMIANSGRFKNVLPTILGQQPFDNFIELSDALYQQAGTTWKISQRRLFVMLYQYLAAMENEASEWLPLLKKDYERSGEKAAFDQLLSSNRVARAGVANRRQQLNQG